MAKPIRKLYLLKNFHEAYYQLTEEARNQMWKKVQENEISQGAKYLLHCDSRWWNEACYGWGVVEYPDVNALQKGTALLEKDEQYRYVDSETYLGQVPDDLSSYTSLESIQITPDTVFELFLMKNQCNDPWASLSQDTRERIWVALSESMEKNGGKILIYCDLYWSTEEYIGYGVIAWPSIEAIQAHFETQQKIGWDRYTYAKLILGKKME